MVLINGDVERVDKHTLSSLLKDNWRNVVLHISKWTLFSKYPQRKGLNPRIDFSSASVTIWYKCLIVREEKKDLENQSVCTSTVCVGENPYMVCVCVCVFACVGQGGWPVSCSTHYPRGRIFHWVESAVLGSRHENSKSSNCLFLFSTELGLRTHVAIPSLVLDI